MGCLVIELHIGRHPISHFVFDRNGDLLVNVGADTDQCAGDKGGPKVTRVCRSRRVTMRAR